MSVAPISFSVVPTVLEEQESPSVRTYRIMWDVRLLFMHFYLYLSLCSRLVLRAPFSNTFTRS